MKSVIVIVFLLAQANAMSWAEVFSPLDDSLGRLVSDVVTDIRDTIDCTVLAVERVLSLDGLFGTSSEYEEKCGGRSSYAPTQSDTSWPDPLTPSQESYTQPQSSETKKQLSNEIDVSVSTVTKDIQSVIDQSTAKQKIQNVKETLTNESDRLSQISAVLKKEVDKIPEAVRKTLKFDTDYTGVDDVVEEVKLLFETEQSNKDSAAAKAVRRVFYEVLTILNVTDVDVLLSDEEEVKLILTNIYQHSNNSLVDVEKQVSTWTKEDHRQITNIKNVLINVSKESSSSNNKTNETFNQTHTINKKVYETDSHNNVTSATQLTMTADESRVATNNATDIAVETKQGKSKSEQIADLANETSLSQTITSITIHKTNKASVEVDHNETHFSSAHLPQKTEYPSSTPPTASIISKNISKVDPVISLLSKSLNAASNASNLSVTQSLMASSARFSQSNIQNVNSTHLPKVDSNSSAGHFSINLSKGLPKTTSPLATSAAQITNTQTITQHTSSSANVSTTELHALNDQLDVKTSPSPSKIAVTDATTSDTKTDPPKSQVDTVGHSDSNPGTSTHRPPEKTLSSKPAPTPKPNTSVEPPSSKQHPKNFRDLTNHIFDDSKSDSNELIDYEDSSSGELDMGVLEQLFGPAVNAEKQKAVQSAKSIIERSQKSQEFINSFFSKVDTKSEPSVFDDPEYFDF